MRTWIVGMGLFMSLLLPLVAAAETQCVCFCGTPSDGAEELGGTYTANKCIDACRDADKEPVGCYTREDQYPENSEICWTREQCEEGTQAGLGNNWYDDVPECDDRKVKMGHCYAAPRSVSTIVAISGNNTFAGLAEYIDALYRYLVPVMAVVVVVMVMIAGLQYILSRGNPSAVKQAKDRMKNAVIGLVLLLSAYTLARLLDPRLVEFTQLRIPKIKEVVTLSDSNKCQTLALAGFEIDHVKAENFADKLCSYEEGGVKGVVTDIADVKDDVDIGGWKEGDFCLYSKCESGATCMSTGCAACEEIAFSVGAAVTIDLSDSDTSFADNSYYPTENTCGLFSDEDGSATEDKNYCLYTDGGEVEIQHTRFATTFPVYFDYEFPSSCVSVPLDCSQIVSTAAQAKKNNADVCGVYGLVTTRQVAHTASLFPTPDNLFEFIYDDITLSMYSVIDPGAYSTICNADPCGIGAIQGKTCAFASSTLTCAGR